MNYSAQQAHCFMPYPESPVPSASEGPLKGLTFAVKDTIDVAGYPTSAGSPTMLAASGIKAKTAPCIETLLNAGAEFIGKTNSDELAFSIIGENIHFGTPLNGSAPDRIPGGSSSGSASAVSCGLADFAVGSDCGGSIRGPASFCGLYGMRPTWGRVSHALCWPLCHSFDTNGIFAKDYGVFRAAAEVFYGKDADEEPKVPNLFLGEEAWSLAHPQANAALAPLVGKLEEAFGKAQKKRLSPFELPVLADAFRHLQAKEAWKSDGAFITQLQPSLGPGVKERFDFARACADLDTAAYRKIQAGLTSHLEETLGRTGIFIIPTTPYPALKLGATSAEKEAFKTAYIQVSCLGGLSGLPWLSIPGGMIDGAPYGLSLIGPRGRDLWLVEIAEGLSR